MALPSPAGTSSLSQTGTASCRNPLSDFCPGPPAFLPRHFLARTLWTSSALFFHDQGPSTESDGCPGYAESTLGPSLGGLPVHDWTRKECVFKTGTLVAHRNAGLLESCVCVQSVCLTLQSWMVSLHNFCSEVSLDQKRQFLVVDKRD